MMILPEPLVVPACGEEKAHAPVGLAVGKMSTGSPATAAPFLSVTVTVILDVLLPSATIIGGTAVMVMLKGVFTAPTSSWSMVMSTDWPVAASMPVTTQRPGVLVAL